MIGMYKALIVDDESKLREVLKIKLEKYCPRISSTHMVSSVDEAYAYIKSESPDIVFLDIALVGESGFDLLRRFEKVNFKVIFVTGFNQYALDAFKVSAVDYLLKPVTTESLITAVEKAHLQLGKSFFSNQFDLLKHNLNSGFDQDMKIAIPGTEAYEFTKISDIIRCEGWQKYTKVVTASGDVILSSYNIGVFRNILEKYGFFLTHKSHMINNRHIVRYQKDGMVVLSDDSSVPVSRRKREEFVEKIVKFL